MSPTKIADLFVDVVPVINDAALSSEMNRAMAAAQRSGRVSVSPTADTRDLERDLRDGARRGSQAAGREVESSFKSSFGTVAKLATEALAVNAFGGFVKGTINAAAQAEQSVGAVDAVFKNNAKTVQGWADDAVDAVGLSSNAYREMATTIGAQLKNMGVAQGEVAGTTDELISLGADLAAQFGGSTADAVSALSSLLRGERDPIERYGVGIKAATIEAHLAAQGLGELEGAAKTQAETQAVLALVMEQTADAQGTFSRELDTTAGKMQVSAARAEELKASIGEGLLPVTNTALGVFDGMLQTFGDLPGGVQSTVVAVAGLAGATAIAVPKVQAVWSALDDIETKSPKTGKALKGLAGAVGIAGAAMAVTTAATVAFEAELDSRSVEDMTKEVLRLSDSHRDLGLKGIRTTYDLGEAWERLTAPGKLDSLDDAVGDLAGINSDADLLTDQFGKMGTAIAGIYASSPEQAAEAFNVILDETGATTDELLAKMPAYRDALTGVANQETLAAAGADGLTTSLGGTAAATEEAEVELTDLQKMLQSVGEGFISPMNIWDEQMKRMAQSTADNTTDATDSWQDHVDNVELSLADYAAALEGELVAQENWRSNLVTISARGGSEVASILAGMGAEGARLTEQMAGATEEDFIRMRDALIREAALGGQGAANELDTKLKVAEAIAAAGGKRTAEAIAKELGVGVDVVKGIAEQYGAVLADGVNPVLAATGAKPIHLGNGRYRMPGGGVAFEADGGIRGGGENHVAQIAKAGEWRVWAEDETGGEAYIPLAPSKRKRSVDIWEQTGHKLGVFAEGGFWSAKDVPAIPSFAPFGSPIGPTGRIVAKHARDKVLELLANTMVGTGGFTGGFGGGASGLQGFAAKLISMGARASEHPAYGGVRGGHMKGSKHYVGRAIDFNYGPGGQNATEMAFFDQVMRQGLAQQFGVRTLWRTPGHFNHLHAEYDQGGWLQKGATLTQNNTGKPEAVLTNPQWEHIERLVAAVERNQGRSGPLIGQAVIRETVDAELTMQRLDHLAKARQI